MISVTNMPRNVKTALSRVIVARAKWETVKEIDKETRIKVLSDNIFTDEETGERIVTPNADYLMSEDNFKKYLMMVYEINFDKGIDSGGWELNFWPVQKAVYDAEDAFIDAISEDIPSFTPCIIKAIKASPDKRKQIFSILGL